jgi:hypothetical protein
MTALELKAALALEAQYFKDSLFQLGKDVGVRVENPNDIEFWDFTFRKALPNSRLEFFPQCYEHPSSGTMGKDCVLLLKDYADKELVLCVDSDYDYLLEKGFQNPFIFQTHVYALENYWSYAEGLKSILEKATNTEGCDFDFVAYFKSYSAVIYEILVYSLYSEKINDGQLTRKNYGKEIGFNTIKILPVEESLAALNKHLNNFIASLNVDYQSKTDFKSFKNRLSELGLTQDNAYLFIPCHDLFGRVTIPLMKRIGKQILKEKYTLSDDEGDNKNAAFARLDNLENDLKAHNKAFQTHPLYERIVANIQAAFN